MDTLVKALESQAVQLRTMLAFRNATDYDLELRLADVATKVGTLADLISSIRSQLRREAETLAFMPDVKLKLIQTNQRLSKYLEDASTSKKQSSPAPSHASVKQVTPEPNLPPVQTKKVTATTAPSWAKPNPPSMPTISPVSAEEFDQIPKYMMKGRLSVERFNESAAQLLRVFEEKYKIMRLAPSKMKDVTRRRYQAYLNAETDETQGVFFVTEEDIREFNQSGGTFKVDPHGRAVLMMLRHLGRLREIRTGGILRYALI